MSRAVSTSMGVRSYKELIAWQLADELRRRLIPVLAILRGRQQFNLCDQLSDAARSAAANIAEGFKRYTPRKFARFLRYAKASLAEFQEHLKEVHDLGCVSNDQFESLSRLAARSSIATARLHAYLRQCDDRR